MLGEGRESKE
ncbi:hypothetical protein E2C01_032975 [Portunus trituberculatus]|uniref:Uncharacterized protein n=1 Tax=Portunus trituberculatus TaxID=210409 RepID=A0A5B7F2I4_PORTR|nr:hypothetical protein [Portunus trituberculatus]